jgi:hypothetical protein
LGGVISTGFYPFWFWNGDITESEVRRQIAEMAQQGVKGFFIHSRQGLQRPYLSESFFRMVDAAIDAAEEHGMSVCLYDEYPYPSGVAGGAVTLGNPRYHATRLAHVSQEVDGGPVRIALPAGKVLSVKAFPIRDGRLIYDEGIDLRSQVGIVLTEDSYVETGLTTYNRKRFFSSEPRPVLEATLPPNRFRIYATCQVEVRQHKYWDHFVDILNPEAVQAFISLTHERYSTRYRDKFGKTIAAIFVDEIEPGWSDGIPHAFAEKYGYDLCDNMPALQDPNHPDHDRVAHDLYRLTYELFCQSFEKPVSEWCRQHGIAYCGEKPSMRMSQLKYMDIPGCDSGHKKAGDGLDVLQGRIRGNARAVASAAYFYDKESSLCECYHSLGWSGTLQDAKIIAEALLVSGVNCLVPHGFFYSTHGLRKHDAPPSFFYQMPYWQLFHKLSERLEGLGRVIDGTHIDAQVLVVDPHSGVPGRDDVRFYEALLQGLAQHHIDFHVVDTDILEMGAIGQGCVTIKDVCATLVVVPAMRVVEDLLRDWLTAFRLSGGQVIECSEGVSVDEVLTLVCQAVKPSLSVQSDGRELSDVYMVRRVSNDRSLWLLLNSGDRAVDVELRVGWWTAAGVSRADCAEAEAMASGSGANAAAPGAGIAAGTGVAVDAGPTVGDLIADGPITGGPTADGPSFDGPVAGVNASANGPVAGVDATAGGNGLPGVRLREVPLDPSVPCGLKRHDGYYTRVIHPFELVVIEAVDWGREHAELEGQCNSHDQWEDQGPDQCDCRRATLESPVLEVPVAGLAEITLHNPNLLRMYEWEMSLLDEDGQPLQTAVVPAVPLSDQLAKGGFRYAPVNRTFFGAVPRLDWPKMHVRYEYCFENRFDGRVELVMEPDSIVGDWTVEVNDSAPIRADQFGPTTAHVYGSLGVDITSFLRQGLNRIRIDLIADKPNHGLLNCLYLAGDFGVRLATQNPTVHACLVPQKRNGLFEAYEENLMPFYSGVVDYLTEFDLDSVPQSSEVILYFRYEGSFREATEVSVNGGDFRPVLWEPRCIRVRADQLRTGRNSLVTRVYTTLIRAFEGNGGTAGGDR